jgi:hypothetical protein
MIRRGITTWLAIWGAAGVVCLPAATSMSELLPRRVGGGQYPVRIVLPPIRAATEPVATPGPAALEEAHLSGDLLAEAATAHPDSRVEDLDLARTQPGFQAVAGKAGGDVLLRINYDLGRPSNVSTAEPKSADIEVAKKVRLNGADMGPSTVRVSPGANILMAREEVVALLERAGHADVATALAGGPATERFISFQEMRTRGLTVTYDPVADCVVLST